MYNKHCGRLGKILAVLLTAGMMIQPVAPVYADELIQRSAIWAQDTHTVVITGLHQYCGIIFLKN